MSDESQFADDTAMYVCMLSHPRSTVLLAISMKDQVTETNSSVDVAYVAFSCLKKFIFANLHLLVTVE